MTLRQDIVYAARGFRRAPVFTSLGILAIALGVGASAAVFSVVDRILFRSLPYPDAERLVSFGMVAPIVPQEFMLGYDYLDWRDARTPLESVGSLSGLSGVGDCDLSDTNPARLRCARVDAGLLSALGVQPILGRWFTREEDRPKAPKVALISYGLWRSRFNGDRGVVGRQVPLDGQPTTVLGVLPAEFELPTLAAADLLVPQALDEAAQRTRRTATLLTAIGRLRPGVSLQQASAGLQPLFQQALQSVSPEFRKDVKLRLRSLRDRQIQDARRASWILLAAVAAVLLIACANLTNLLLARGATRQREMTVRAALGAGRGRLVRQALTESTLVALSGGAAGCGLAFLLVRLFVALAPEGIPHLNQAGVDFRVLFFALAASGVSGVIAGVVPALQSPSVESLAGSRALGTRHQRFRQVLVSAQICVSLILLAGASLLLRSLWNLQNQPLGMRTDGVLTVSVTLGQTSYPDAGRRLAFFEELEGRLGRLPGVAEAALSDTLPPAGNLQRMIYTAIDVEGRPRVADAGTGGRVAWRIVTPRYFAALGIPIVRGRAFQEADRDPNQNVVVISDALARRMFPGESPLGKRIRPGRVGPWLTVVGVAGDVKNSGLVERGDPEYYQVRKHAAANVGRSATLILRGVGDPGAMAGVVRAQVAALDPMLPVKIETMGQLLGNLAARPRFNALLLGLFAGMGLLLAAIGLYGVVSYLVTQRTQEIGVRMALGAQPGAITRLVLWHAARWTVPGAGLGLIGSLFAVRLLQSLLFQVPARDPWALAASVSVLLGVAFAAAWIPAHRAARTDPMRAVREE